MQSLVVQDIFQYVYSKRNFLVSNPRYLNNVHEHRQSNVLNNFMIIRFLASLT
jgi:hypothetical protein